MMFGGSLANPDGWAVRVADWFKAEGRLIFGVSPYSDTFNHAIKPDFFKNNENFEVKTKPTQWQVDEVYKWTGFARMVAQ